MYFNKKLKKTFIIAEAGNNHEGSLSNAKKLVQLAAKAGVDAIKFQTFLTEKFIKRNNTKRFNQLKKFQLSFNQFKELKNLAHKKKILLLEALWSIIYSDENVDMYESNLMMRFS